MTNVGLAVVASISVCPQCGEDWGRHPMAMSKLEYCPRCGSPVAVGYDPLRPSLYGGTVLRVHRRAKLIVRSGVLGMGLIGILTGLLLCYGGWFNNTPGALDIIQLWVSRIGGPVLLTQGFMYCWLPFRRLGGATILRFPVHSHKRVPSCH